VYVSGNVYVAGYTQTGTSVTSAQDKILCYSASSGSSCGTTQLQQTGTTLLTSAQTSNGNAVLAFATSNFSAVALNGGSVIYQSHVNYTDVISGSSYTFANSLPMASNNGFLGITTTLGVYVYNLWTGAPLWNMTSSVASNAEAMYAQNAFWYLSSGLGYFSASESVVAANPLTGGSVGQWSVTTAGSYTYDDTFYAYWLGNGTIYGVQGYTFFKSGIPASANATASISGYFSAPPLTLLEEIEKNKLWIIGVVAAIVVLAVIAVIANKNRGGTGSKDQDYVSMNNQGGRV